MSEDDAMISKDEQDIDIISEEELLEIDSVDEHELDNSGTTVTAPVMSSPTIVSPIVNQASKKSDEDNHINKEIDLLADEPTLKQEQAYVKSSEPPNPKSPTSSDGSFNSSPKKRSLFLPIVGIAALAILGGIWYQTASQIENIEKSLAESNQKALQGISEQDKALDESYRQLAQQVDLTQKKLAEMGSQQQEIQSTLSRITGHKEDNWLLAEALYLSRLAVERLQTTQDVKTAIGQLTAADDRLRQVADPSLMPVRKILVDKITELKAVNAPDFEGLWLQLGTLSEMSDKLVPIRSDKNKVIEETTVYPTGWKAALKQSWFEVKSLVKVRSPQENASTPIFAGKTLSELNEDGLKRGFRLFIEQARWALIQREAWLYQGSIDNAQKWLKTYFSRDATGQLMLSQLEQLKNNNIQMTVPDVSSTVTAINNLIQQRQKLLAG